MARTFIPIRPWGVTGAAALVTALFAAGAAAEDAVAAEGRPALAAPGRCAEPRKAVDVRTGDGFSVVGPVAALFDPVDVAAGPAEGDTGLALRPVARPLVRPGACDQPGSGCRAALPTSRVVEPPPIDPGDPPPPGFGGGASRSR
ncbi:MAG: hypothetical protein R3F35_20900 [Myxococcota bacterium]